MQLTLEGPKSWREEMSKEVNFAFSTLFPLVICQILKLFMVWESLIEQKIAEKQRGVFHKFIVTKETINVHNLPWRSDSRKCLKISVPTPAESMPWELGVNKR